MIVIWVFFFLKFMNMHLLCLSYLLICGVSILLMVLKNEHCFVIVCIILYSLSLVSSLIFIILCCLLVLYFLGCLDPLVKHLDNMFYLKRALISTNWYLRSSLLPCLRGTSMLWYLFCLFLGMLKCPFLFLSMTVLFIQKYIIQARQVIFRNIYIIYIYI